MALIKTFVGVYLADLEEKFAAWEKQHIERIISVSLTWNDRNSCFAMVVLYEPK